jgi:hypothetical protein
MKTTTALSSVCRPTDTSEVTLTRGVTPQPSDPPAPGDKPRIEHCIHWLTYTVPYEVGYENAFLPHKALYLTGEVLPNIQGYNVRLALTYGSVSFHTQHPENKICVRLQGEDLQGARAAGVDVSDLLAYALGLGATITWLDFAVDYHGPSSPAELNEAWESGLVKAPTKYHKFEYSGVLVNGECQKAYTMYIGSEASQRSLRCYDKAAESNSQGPWTRIELVARKEYATRLVQAMLNEGIGEAGKQAIRDFVQCDIAWFNEAITGLSVYIEPSHRKNHKTIRWLLTQVLSPFHRTLVEEAIRGETEVRDAFQRALQDAEKHRTAA